MCYIQNMQTYEQDPLFPSHALLPQEAMLGLTASGQQIPRLAQQTPSTQRQERPLEWRGSMRLPECPRILYTGHLGL